VTPAASVAIAPTSVSIHFTLSLQRVLEPAAVRLSTHDESWAADKQTTRQFTAMPGWVPRCGGCCSSGAAGSG
jgi:hypothetical protein